MSPERERLEEIRERVEAATEGPWKLAGKHAGYWIEAPGRLCIPHAKSDTIFIANARADIPWLLDQLEQAEQRDAARMDAHDAKAALAASHERERGLREALELIAWSKPPIRETEGEWRLKAQVVAREALAAQSKESEDSRA